MAFNGFEFPVACGLEPGQAAAGDPDGETYAKAVRPQGLQGRPLDRDKGAPDRMRFQVFEKVEMMFGVTQMGTVGLQLADERNQQGKVLPFGCQPRFLGRGCAAFGSLRCPERGLRAFSRIATPEHAGRVPSGESVDDAWRRSERP